MTQRRRTAWFSWLVLLSSIAALTAQSTRIDDAALKRAGQTGDDWLTYGLNQAETRFSPLNDINAGNVSRLTPAWS